MTNLLALDPAKTKPSWGARFLGGKFSGFVRIDYKKIINQIFPDEVDAALNTIPTPSHVCVIERPYIHQGHSPRSHISLAIAVGELAFYMRLQGFKIEFAESWGNQGWLMQFFGRVPRQTILTTAMQIAKADGVAVENSDQGIAYCLGLWWLRNNLR